MRRRGRAGRDALPARVGLVALAALCCLSACSAQLSMPISKNEHMDVSGNKYVNRKARPDRNFDDE